MSYNTKVYNEQGGDVLVVADGGALNFESGGNALAGSFIFVVGGDIAQ